jgi:hypothetical protein
MNRKECISILEMWIKTIDDFQLEELNIHEGEFETLRNILKHLKELEEKKE